MRIGIAIVAVVLVGAAGSLGPFGGVLKADAEICIVDPCNVSRLTLPVVAHDDNFTQMNQMSINVGCIEWKVPGLPGDFFTMVGYEVVAAPEDFFYSHAYTVYNAEPFTHTGVLATFDGPGGPYWDNTDILNREGVFNFGPTEPGLHQFNLFNAADAFPIHPGSSSTVLNIPGDCVPVANTPPQSRYVFDPTVPGGWLVMEMTGTGTFTNGTCAPFNTPMEFDLFADGQATSDQADTGDHNEGFRWPGPPVLDGLPPGSDDWFNLYVQNPAEPEAYLLAVAPGLSQAIGRTAWKNCLWDFELLVLGLVSQAE